MKKFLLFILACMTVGTTVGQLSGPKSIPGDYATIALAINDLNSLGVTGGGGVTFNVAPGHTESITAPLTITVTGSASDPIVFQKFGSGVNPIVSRTDGGSISPSTLGGSGDAIIRLEGTDFITFDGIDVTAGNQGIEYGYLTHKPSATNGCQNVTIKNCTVTMTKGTSAYVIGIYIGNGTTSTSSATGVTVTAASGTNANILITGNTIQNVHAGVYVRGSSASGFYDTDVTVGQSGAGNTIQNYGGGSATSTYGVYFIYVSNPTSSYNIINNSGGGGSAHTATLYGTFYSTVLGNVVGNNNTITLSNTAASSTTQFLYSASTVTSLVYNNNTFGSGTISSTGTVYLLYASSGTNNVTISGNMINGTFTRTGASGSFYCYYNNGSPTGTENIYGNTFSNIALAGTSAFYGIQSTTAASHTSNIYNNTISNITGGSGAMYGLYLTTANFRSVYGNLIHTFTGGGTVYGINIGGGNPGNVYKNKIYNLSSSATGALVYGVYISSGTLTNVYNNFISDLKAPAATGLVAVNGIYISGGTNINAYYNTVFLNASSSSATTFGTSGIYKSSTTASDLRNNIIVNQSVPGPTGGLTVAYRWSGAYNATYYSTLSNSNNFYAGNPDASHLIFYDGTNSDLLITDFQTRVAPMDALSFSELPPFANIVTAPYDLRISTDLPLIATKCESGGVVVSSPVAITDDYEATPRYPNPGYPDNVTYPASSPDVGADEFAGRPLFTCTTPAPGNTQSTANAICMGQSVTLSLQNATAGTGVTYQWQSSPDNIIAYSNISGANSTTYTVAPTSSMYYKCVVTCNNGPESVSSAPLQITFANNVLTTTPGTRCGTGTVDLQATAGSGTLTWYAGATGGTSIGTGSPFTTPEISTSTTYYVGTETTTSGSIAFGSGTSLTGNTSYPTAFGNRYYQDWSQMVYTASELFALGLRAGNITSITLNIAAIGSSASVSNYTVSLGSTANTILTGFTTTGLTTCYGPATYTSAAGANLITFSTPFPWDGISNIILDIRGTGINSTYNATTYYTATAGNTVVYAYSTTNNTSYYTSNPTATTSTSRLNVIFGGQIICSSPRVPVLATVNPAPAITPTATPPTICAGESSTLDVTSSNSGYSYVWNPGSLSGPTHSVQPSATQVYTVTATDNTLGPYAGCTVTGNATVTVNPLPGAITITPSAPILPAGTIQSLVASSDPVAQYFNWAPFTDLFTDAGALIAYNNEQLATVYTKPQATRTYTVTATSLAGCTKTQNVVVTSCPAAPATPAVSNISTTAFDLSWSYIPGSQQPVDYTIDLATDAGYSNHVAGYPVTVANTVFLQNVTALAGNTEYFYKITANGASGCTNEFVTGSVTTCTAAPGAPSTANVYSGSFDLNWSAPAGGSASSIVYTINIATDGGFVNPIAGSPFTTSNLTLPVSGLSGNTQYFYRIGASGSCAGSTVSGSVTTCPGVPGVPVASAIAMNSMTLDWTAPVGGSASAITYSVYVATSAGFGAQIPGSPFITTGLSLGLTSLAGNTEYFFKVKATGTCDSQETNTTSAITCPGVPGTPTVTGTTANSFVLNWTAPAGGSGSTVTYLLDVATDGGFLNPIAGSPFTVSGLTKTLTALTGNSTYYFRVKANGSCSGVYSGTGNVTTCPSVPGSLLATPNSSGFNLSWTSSLGGAAVSPVVYTIDVSTNAGFTAPIGGSPFTVTDPNVSLALSGLAGNTIYYYRVLATGSCASTYASGNVITCPATPASTSVSNIGAASFTLTWSPVTGTGAAIHYSVEVYTNPGFTGPVTGSPFTVNHPTTTLTVTGLDGGVTYYYRVKAVASCSSGWITGSVTTFLCYEPLSLTAYGTSGSSGYAQWTSPNPTLLFEYELRTSGAAGSGSTGLVQSGTTSNLNLNFGGLSATTTYQVYVRAHCDDITTIWSNASFTTKTCALKSIPYTENFDTYTPPATGCWTIEDVNADYITWYTSPVQTYSAPNKLSITKSYTPGVNMNDWAFSEGLQLQAGHSYTVAFYYRAASSSFNEKLEVKWGPGPLASLMTSSAIFSNTTLNNATYMQGTASFVAPADGAYWIGWHCFSDALKSGIFIDNISVCEVPGAGVISGPVNICSPQTSQQYSIVANPSATSYIWTVPPGATITSALPHTNIITVDFPVDDDQSGNVTAQIVTACGTGAASTLAVTVNPLKAAGISIVASAETVCEGQQVDFTATPVNGGSNPQYQWKSGDSPISGATNVTYSYVPANGDAISCVLTSNYICVYDNPATSNTITLTVNPNLPVSVSIAAEPSGPICDGTSVTFTATPVNGGTPSYQWKLNGTDVGSDQATYTNASLANNDVVSCIMTSSETCKTGSPATSNEITMTVNPVLPVSVSIVAEPAGPICNGTSVTFTATPVNGGTPVYQWKLNGTDVGSDQDTYTNASLANDDVVTCVMTSSEICKTGSPATSNEITMVVNPILPVSVSIAAEPAGPICDGTSVTFTATPVNGGTPSYQWKLNGIDVGTDQATYVNAALANNDMVTCVMTSSEICKTGSPATSNTITMTVNPNLPVSVSIAADPAGPVCAGTLVTFTATPVNGGTPSYQWKLNGSDVGSDQPTYSNALLANSDVVSCVMTSSETCKTGSPATSNLITMTVNPILPVSVSIAAEPAGPVCAGTNVVFTATPVNGGTPTYQWKLNGSDVGAGLATYSNSTLVTGDVVSCVMISSEVCKSGSPATSNLITMTVNPILPVSVSIVADPAGTICAGTPVTFTATPVNGGTPAYQWKVNGGDVGTGLSTFTSSTLANNDVVTCVLTSSEVCTSGNPATSNPIAMTVNPILPVSVSIAAVPAGPVCDGTPVTFTATPVNGGTPSYQWKLNGANVGTNQATYTNSTLANHDVVTCVMTSSETCKTGSPATSNSITITINLPVNVGLIITPDANPVCANTVVNFTSLPINGGANPTYQWKVNTVNVPGATNSTFSLIPAHGDIVTCLFTSSEPCTVVNPVLSNLVTMTVNPILPVSVSIAAQPSGPICTGTVVIFTATPVNGGTPVYQWKLNGTDVGTGLSTYENATLESGDIVSCVMTSSEVCKTGSPATSNAITMTVHPILPVSVTIAAVPSETICAGTPVTFTATPVNGGIPSYQWKLNGTDVGTNQATYSNPALANNDVVTCVMTSSEMCQSGGPATSNAITMTVHPVLPVSVSIDAVPSGPVCAGTSVTYTATPVNGGTPVYQWFLRTTAIEGATNAIYTYIPDDRDSLTCVMTSSEVCKSGSPATSNMIVMTVNPQLQVSVTISPNANPVCAGTTVLFTAVPTNGGSSPVFQWFVNTVAMGANSEYFSYEPLHGDVVECRLTSSETCAAGNPATSLPLVMTVNPLLPVSVSVTASANPVCTGTSVTFTATPVNGGYSPSYQWKLDGNDISGATNVTYTTVPANGSQYSCVLTSSIVCAGGNPATSNVVTMTVNSLLPASVSIVASLNPVCAGTTVTFTATPVNGGSSPSYQWRVNGSRKGTNNPVYSYIPLNGDVITCTMTSNATCVTGSPAVSNPVTMTVNPILPVSVSIAALPAGPVCAGTSVIFTATAVNGGTPTYQWKLNGSDVGLNQSTYTNATLINGDVVTCVLTSSENCTSGNPATSNPITMVVNPILPVSVSITALPAGSICAGTPVIFSATPVNGGVPVYQWKLNGINVGVDQDTYTDANLVDGDVVTCEMTSSEVCKTGSPAVSNPIAMTVNPLLPVSVTIGTLTNPVCEGTLVSFTAVPVNGGDAPVFQWTVNNVTLGSNSSEFSYIPLNGDVVKCTVTSNALCASGNPATSAPVTMVVNPIIPVSVSIVASYNPVGEGTHVTFTATAVNGGTSPVYQWYVNNIIVGGNTSTYNYVPVNGDQIYCVVTSNADCQTGSPATSNTITMTVTPGIPIVVRIQNVIIHNLESVCYNATEVITAAGGGYYFQIENGGSAIMIAGKKVSLMPGTTIFAGGYLHAYISDQYCNTLPIPVAPGITGTEENPFVSENADFRIYPNPTNGNFTLEQKGGVDYPNVKVEVYNMQGERMISEDIVGQKKHEFMFSEASNGLYFVKIIAGDYVETIKLVKTR